MLTCVVEVEIHLPCVCVSELPKLQFDDNQASQPAMKEEEIHTIPFGTDSEPFLTSNECKIISQFQEKLFELSNKSLFQLSFGVLILQS